MATKRSSPPITDIEDPRYVKALSHPLRIRILALLEERDASPVQLASKLEATLGTVAYHVRTLEKLGLIELVATHQRRGATEHVYAAREHPRFSDEVWSNTAPTAKHLMIASALSQIGQYVTQSAAAGGFDASDAHFTRTALKLDEQGWSELADATRKWMSSVGKLEDQASKRLKKTGEEPTDAGLVLMFFEAVPFFDAPSPTKGKGAGKRGKAAGTTARRRTPEPVAD
jgi:DNA-binding transcriptional ArsR family regulator